MIYAGFPCFFGSAVARRSCSKLLVSPYIYIYTHVSTKNSTVLAYKAMQDFYHQQYHYHVSQGFTLGLARVVLSS